jgi:uncharacterized protein YhbP (UPF0306 family)
MNDLNNLAKEIIEKNQYLALNTVDTNKKPWSSILAYTFDKNYNFYYVSLPTSKHSVNIEANPNVSIAIYDSTQGFGLGVGLQIQAEAKKLEQSKIANVSEVYFGRKFPYGNISNDFTVELKKLLADGVYSFYQLTPIHIWINDPHADTDKRVEVELK